MPIVSTYPPNEITRGLTSLTAFPMARSVTPLSGGAGGGEIAPTVFVETGPQAWAESDITPLTSGTPSMDPAAGDRPGPVSLGVTVSASVSSQSVPPLGTLQGDTRPFSSDTRLVVMGDSDVRPGKNVERGSRAAVGGQRGGSGIGGSATIPVRRDAR